MASMLRSRPRLRRLIQRGARGMLAATGETTHPLGGSPIAPEVDGTQAPTSVLAPPDVPGPAGLTAPPTRGSAHFAREFVIPWLAAEEFPATRQLYERLDERDVAAIERLIAEDSELAVAYDSNADVMARRQMVLAYGIWLEHTAATEKTGLIARQPPEEVHLMARGPLAAAGGLYEADFVVDALASVDVDITTVTRALDFGCSSGRVVRVLAAAYPDTQWHGCDPNRPAIAWAQENLPGIEFFANDDSPPLPLPDAHLDLVYAISIWSHFEPGLGLRWFEEMHRLIRPGGHLICTTHGLTSVAHYALSDLRSPEQSEEIADALYRRGWWYAPEFGEEGDWGVVNPAWGTAFLSPEWMLAQLCPRWRVLEFAPGRNQENQDVYLLERV